MAFARNILAVIPKVAIRANVIAVLVGLGLAFVEFGFAWGMQRLLSVASDPSHSQDQLFPMTAAVIGAVAIARAFLLYQLNYQSSVALEMTTMSLRNDNLRKILMSEGAQVSTSSALHLHSEVFPRGAYFFSQLGQFLPLVLQCVLLLAGVFYLEWRVGLIATFFVMIMGAIIRLLQRHVKVLAQKLPIISNQVMQDIEKVCRTWLIVRIFQTGKREYEHSSRLVCDHSRFLVSLSARRTVASVVPGVCGIGLVLGMFAAVIWWGIGERSILIAQVFLLVRFTQQLSGIAFSYGNLLEQLPYFRQILSFESFKETASELSSERTDSSQLLDKPPRIDFSNVSFSYKSSSHPVVSNLSFSIESGDILGVSGPSGVGKSTILSLMLGLIRPTTGQIRVNDLDPETFRRMFFKRIGYVGPDPFLIHGTVRDNLSYGLSHTLSDEQCWLALQQAGLNYEIDSKPGKLDYLINSAGEGLSAGQKQRLSLARSLARNPALLILDEATANLDNETERLIAENINQLKTRVTVVVVSHREGILKPCSSILPLRGLPGG